MTTENTPTEDTPTEDTPTEDTPTEDTPTEDTPTEDTPTEDTPTEDTPTESKEALSHELENQESAPSRRSSPLITLLLCGLVGAATYLVLMSQEDQRHDHFLNAPSSAMTVNVYSTTIKRSDAVTQDEAKRLARYLLAIGFADGEERRVSLDRRGKTYLVQIAVLPSAIADLMGQSLYRAFATEISTQVFAGAPVDVHLCDPQLRPLVVTPMYRFGLEKRFNQLQIFHQVGLEKQAQNLGLHLAQAGLDQGSERSMQLTRVSGVYQVKVVVKSGVEKRAEYESTFRELAAHLSRAVFGDQELTLHLTDGEFTSLKSFPTRKRVSNQATR